ncbi:MAG: hypothetical protein EXR98_20125 [Gemmataceae bacterium]|nr:hypothetical protein [Gemmataceae bacterium]
MQDYPAFLGQPGKPRYLVVVLAKLKVPLATARAMGDEQRADLLFDWQAGRQVLLEHRKYLRRHLRSMHHHAAVGLVLHAVRGFVNDYPWPTLIGVLLLAMVAVLAGLAMWRRDVVARSGDRPTTTSVISETRPPAASSTVQCGRWRG